MNTGATVTVSLAIAASLLACVHIPREPYSICVFSAATAHSRLEIFGRPFAGEYMSANVFDHDLPLLFDDKNDFQLTACGQRARGVKGHNGYDWGMPRGTQLLAVADGKVVRAEEEPTLDCPPLGRRVKGARVVSIEVRPNGTDVLRAMYGHLDSIAVKVGDFVHAGDTIGTSGSTGCSTAPHLHLNVARIIDGREVLIDPYGWHSPETDPWEADRRGAASIWLWKPGAAPRLFRNW